METTFSFTNQSADCWETHSLLILVTAAYDELSAERNPDHVHGHLAFYRLGINSEYLPTEKFKIPPYLRQSREQAIFQALVRAIHEAEDKIFNDHHDLDEGHILNLSLEICSDSEDFLNELRDSIKDKSKEDFCTRTDHYTPRTLKFLRLCERTTGYHLTANELKKVARSQNPREALKQLY